MIPLRLKVDPLPLPQPIVARLVAQAETAGPYDATFVGFEDGVAEYDLAGFPLRLHAASAEALENDVILLMPRQASAHRLIRADSRHNTFLVTERCDQTCLMCSQPPKKHHVDLFPSLKQAALLAPAGARIGISGGEPTLFKDELFDLLLTVLEERPDLSFHVLTNGQHFGPDDADILRRIPHDRVLWGIPLYSTDPEVHDRIVAKPGAFDRLMKTFALMARAGSAIELRTVVMQPNVENLPSLARFITTRLPFISVWAIMQLENIGYGRMNWDSLFLDNSLDFTPIAKAIDIVRARGHEALLYNFPVCTVPSRYRAFAPATISDWKRRYLDTCDGCGARDTCGGFFEWYPDARGFSGIQAL